MMLSARSVLFFVLCLTSGSALSDSKSVPEVPYPEYRAQLESLEEEDQRIAVTGDREKMRPYNERHVAALKKIISDIGWPTIDLVGEEASSAAWIICQHADHDLAFQKYCLDLMRPFVAKNKIDRKEYAYLVDRVLINEGKPQLFGTQMVDVKDWPTEEPVFKPIANREQLEHLRAIAGMEPFSVYKQIAVLYGKMMRGEMSMEDFEKNARALSD